MNINDYLTIEDIRRDKLKDESRLILKLLENLIKNLSSASNSFIL